jgi:adenine specific DNA methylase N-4/N-6
MPVFGDLQPAVWRWSAATVESRSDELFARYVHGRKGTRLDIFQIDRLHPGRRKKLKTIWNATEVGSSDSAKLSLRKKFGEEIQFATPKPEPLLERIINAATEPGDYVWDMFAGSGTTGVVAHRLGRKFVLAERNPSTVATHIRMRLDDAGASPYWLEVQPRY